MFDTHTPYGVLSAEHAHELLPVPIDLLDRQILTHSRRWQTVGIFLRCVTCGCSQKASESAHPFTHHPICCFSTDIAYPWLELATILRQLPIDRPTNAASDTENHS